MPGWIIAAAIASIAITGILTFVLWQLNAPMRERAKAGAVGGDGYVPATSGDRHSNDGTDDGGGSDGGGGDGGGGE